MTVVVDRVVVDEVVATTVAANTAPNIHRKWSRSLRLRFTDPRQCARNRRAVNRKAKVEVEVEVEAEVKAEVEAEEKAEMEAAKVLEVKEVNEIKRFILILIMTPLKIHHPQLYRIVERARRVTCLAFLKDLLPHNPGRNQREAGRRKVLRHLHSNVPRSTSLLNTSPTMIAEDLFHLYLPSQGYLVRIQWFPIPPLMLLSTMHLLLFLFQPEIRVPGYQEITATQVLTRTSQ
mmetsp:Transcript_24711/g.38825  ORF Transcript_24711/g.38825 Transcript_24711/m.38825 type:complete len:233 (+) Transcript_24711:2023-2721(+)